MAIKKTIILSNGVPMDYHRIAEINNIVNRGTFLRIRSYVNEEQRLKEKNKEIRYSDDIYVIEDYVSMEYNDKLTIKEAYDFLKTTDKYKGSEDIFEEKDEVINDE